MNQKVFASIVLIVVIVAIVAIGGYFIISKNSPAPATSPTITNPPPQQPVVPTSNNPVVPTTPSKATVIEIKTGTSFGECGGYCKMEFVINSKNIIYIKSSWDNSSYPEVKKEILISSDEWNSLVGNLDVKKFNLLPERIGCPDCADGGAEWIEISDGKATKKVTFEYGASISGIDPFVKKLREIRKNVSSQFDK